MNIEEFIKTYADSELIKVNKRRQQGLDIFTGKPLDEVTGKSPKGTKSPVGKSPKYIRVWFFEINYLINIFKPKKMSKAAEEYERIVTEYKNYDIDGLRRELQDDLNKEINVLNLNQDAHRGETTKKIDGYERLQREHKDLQRENNEGHENRKAILSHIQDENTKFDKFAHEATEDKSKLRTDLANKEHPLRVLQDQLAVLGLENKNLQLVIDTETALREAKANAEVSALRTVNTDLKDQVSRVETDILDEKSKKTDAKRILDDLTAKHQEAEKAFKALLADAEKRRDQVQRDLAALKETLGSKRASNEQLRGKVDGNNKVISKFREEIHQLNADIETLRSKSEQDIKKLEADRESNEKVINDLRNNLNPC